MRKGRWSMRGSIWADENEKRGEKMRVCARNPCPCAGTAMRARETQRSNQLAPRHLALGLLPSGLTGPANVKRDGVLCGPAIRRPSGSSIHVTETSRLPFVAPPRPLFFPRPLLLGAPSPFHPVDDMELGGPTTGCGARGGRGWRGPVRLLFVAGCSLSLVPSRVFSVVALLSCHSSDFLHQRGILSTQGAEMAELGALVLGFVPRCQLWSCGVRSNRCLVLSYDFSTFYCLWPAAL